MENINQYIIYGNFTKKHTDSLLKITDMYMTKYIKFELMFVYLDENRLFLIDKLKSLPEKEWVVCSTIVKSGVLQLQLGIPNQKVLGLHIFSSFNSMTGSPIFYGKLEKMLRSTLFIKDSEDIGIAYISSTLLIKKLEKADAEDRLPSSRKGRSEAVVPHLRRPKQWRHFSPTDLTADPPMLGMPLSTLLTTDTISKKLYSKLLPEQIKMLRQMSKSVKSTVDRNTEQIIIRFNPEEIDYESLSDIKSVCKRFDKKLNECTFEVEFNMEKDTEKNELFFTPSIEALKLSDVKLIAKFSLSLILDESTQQEAYKLLFETIASLPNIVSLDIVFGELGIESHFLNDSFTNCEVKNVLKSLTNLSVLRIFNVKMAWIPLFDCLKNLKLDELVLSQVDLVTALNVDDTTKYDTDTFLEEFVKAVPNITRFGVKHSCNIDGKYAIDIFLLAVFSLPRITSLDFSENDLYEEPSFFRDNFSSIMQNIKQIKQLNISRNCFFHEDENEGAVDLSALFIELPNLEVLKMSETKLNQEAIEILTPALQELSKLKMLDISKNYDLDEEDVVTLQNNLPKVKLIYDL